MYAMHWLNLFAPIAIECVKYHNHQHTLEFIKSVRVCEYCNGLALREQLRNAESCGILEYIHKYLCTHTSTVTAQD